MQPADIAALRKRVEEATKPLWIGTDYLPRARNEWAAAIFGASWTHHDAGLLSQALKADIHAVRALIERVRPGAMWRVGHDPDDGSSFKAEIVTAAPECAVGTATANKLEHALTAALLHALDKEHADAR